LPLAEGYTVHGVTRRSSLFNTYRGDQPYRDLHDHDVRFLLHYGDLTDTTNLIRIMPEGSRRRFTISPHRATSK
jgi:GDPmannose 4,6-dehydratase